MKAIDSTAADDDILSLSLSLSLFLYKIRFRILCESSGWRISSENRSYFKMTSASFTHAHIKTHFMFAVALV